MSDDRDVQPVIDMHCEANIDSALYDNFVIC
jgi:hypothetical protein